MKGKQAFIGMFVVLLLLFTAASSWADWEAGAKAGYDSNVDRALNGGRSDFLLSGYAAYTRVPTFDSRLDWTLSLLLEGTAYARVTDLSNATVTFAPGLAYAFSPVWSIHAAPFLQAKGVNDSDQSAWAMGARVSLKQQWRKDVYTGQHYMYTDSRAREDVYSSRENALGAVIGKYWTPAFFMEATYEYSRGDAFRTLETTSYLATTVAAPGGARFGRGGNRVIYSTTFNEYVVKETVDRHSVGLSAGYDLSKALSTIVGYTYTTASGDSGTVSYHTVYCGLGYRF
ncbi:MAG: hypothetical protein CVU61_02610 [Deltaproteobacteria bacterium HGW-Deltaproteobacteria-19]|nr:MAG: hypothetical protein CVU61_02610 [Deltaproteobacteria bacterium HGW-Deltaproteobacteria-19]